MNNHIRHAIMAFGVIAFVAIYVYAFFAGMPS